MNLLKKYQERENGIWERQFELGIRNGTDNDDQLEEKLAECLSDLDSYAEHRGKLEAEIKSCLMERPFDLLRLTNDPSKLTQKNKNFGYIANLRTPTIP